MEITKAVITAAGRGQRMLPLQTLIDSDGVEKSVLGILIDEILHTGVEEICIVVGPGDEEAYAQEAGDHLGRLHFVQQDAPLGYGHAIYCARHFAGDSWQTLSVAPGMSEQHNAEMRAKYGDWSKR